MNLSAQDLKYAKPYLINKLIAECDLKFQEPKNIRLLYYDIETYHALDTSQVPLCKDSNSHISVICLYDATEHSVSVFTTKIMSQFEPKEIQIDEIPTAYYTFADEEMMCRAFLMKLKSYPEITIASSFNGSYGLMHERHIGYDLPFIHSRARYYNSDWHMLKKHGMKSEYGKNEHTMITQIRCAPNLYFYDYRYLHTAVNSKHFVHFKNYKLNSYLEYYGLESKLDIGMSYEQM